MVKEGSDRIVSRSNVPLRAVVGALCLLCLAACSGGAGTGARIAVVLRGGVDDAGTTLQAHMDDLTQMTQRSRIVVPRSLQSALDEADDAARSGAVMTSEERGLIASAEQYATAYNRLNSALQFAVGWESGLSDDIARLIAVSRSNSTELSEEFASYLRTLEERVLRGLMCSATRSALDDLGEAQATQQQAVYDFFPYSGAGVQNFMTQELSIWDGVDEVIDVVQLAEQTVEQHDKYVSEFNQQMDGLTDVIESPSGTLANANIVYFRVCVARKG